uniref:Uncharacterized protein ORF-c39_022 n=1 Tax=Saccharolobus solfataricus TaxID=2287 RepID=Q9UXJ7_SACSO|nr:hypothetical protein [Saccharolobus solfataricus P2]
MNIYLTLDNPIALYLLLDILLGSRTLLPSKTALSLSICSMPLNSSHSVAIITPSDLFTHSSLLLTISTNDVLALGSYAMTLAPISTKSLAIFNATLSLVSSVLGLNAIPKIQIVLPFSSPNNSSIIFTALLGLSSLTFIAASTIFNSSPNSLAKDAKARVSLGKHEPP